MWREGDPAGNPWGLSFMAMFHMANDSGLFRTAEQLEVDGWALDGNQYVRGDVRMLPLYEAKMAHFYDHRLGTYEGATQAQLNVGTLPRFDDADHADPSRLPLPRYWVPEAAVNERLSDRWSHGWLLGWRDIARSTDERTLISTVIPRTAVGHTTPLAMSTAGGAGAAALTANLSSFCLDYIIRQKASGTHLTYTYMKQLPVLAPERYEEPVLWDREADSLGAWITAHVLELAYTAYDLAFYARDLGYDGPPFGWNPLRRELLRAELDAAYFHLYGIERDDVGYIMDTFKVVREKDEKAHGEYRTKRLILERYDAMADAIRTGQPYRTSLDPPPGHGPRNTAAAASLSD